jgi:lysophospholipase L1-like esterase
LADQTTADTVFRMQSDSSKMIAATKALVGPTWIRVLAARWLVMVTVAIGSALPLAAQAESAASKYAKDLAAFAAADKTNPPPRNAILFVGGSSIRMWDTLAQDFAGLPVIQRGYGGSQMSDTLELIEQIVLPYHPRHIVLYAGENDVANGRSAPQILEDFKAFVHRTHAALPQSRVVFLALKPSPSRQQFHEQFKEVNRLIAQCANTTPGVVFVDDFTPLLGPDGQPRADLFQGDKLHLNAQGYALWTRLVLPQVR